MAYVIWFVPSIVILFAIIGWLILVLEMFVALLMFVVTLLVWQTSVGAMQTAHEGVALGRRYHTIWAPVRAPLAIFFLTPLPMIKGLTILQALALGAVYMSVGVADTVWGGFTKYISEHPMQVAASLQSPALTDAVPDQMLYTAVLKKVAMDDGMTGKDWRYTYDGDGYSINVHFGVATPADGSLNTAYGQLNFTCGNPAPALIWDTVKTKAVQFFGEMTKDVTGGLISPIESSNDAIFGSAQCQARFKATDVMLTAMDAIAANLVDSQQGNGKVPTIAAMTAAQVAYHAAIASLMGDPAKLQEEMDKQLTGFSNSAYDMGWVATAFYYPAVISVINSQQKAIESVMPTVNSPSFNLDDLAKSTGISKADLTPAYKSYVAYLNTTTARTSASITGGSGDDGFLGNRLKGITDDLQKGNLISVMGSYGSGIIDAGEAIATFIAIGTLGGAGAGAIIGMEGGPLGSAAGAFIGGAIAAFLGKLGAIGMAIAGVLIVEGAVMSYVIPFVPSIVILFAIIGWLILVLEMFVALPLFAAAFAFAEGEGVAPQQTNYGTAVIGGILMRPTLIVFGFVFSYLLMVVGGRLVGLVFGVVFDTVSSDGGIGPIAFVTLLGVLVATVTSVVYFIARLITHLAEHVPQWIGGNAGANLGVDGQAQSVAQQGGQRGSAGAGAAVGYASQVGGGMAEGGSAGVKGFREQQAKASKPASGRGAGGSEGGASTHQTAPANPSVTEQKTSGKLK